MKAVRWKVSFDGPGGKESTINHAYRFEYDPSTRVLTVYNTRKSVFCTALVTQFYAVREDKP